MKNIFTLLCYLFAMSCATAQSIQWSAATVVADGATYDNVYPRLALTTGNSPLVVWENASGFVYSARWNGNGFSLPLTLNPAGVSPYIASWVGAESAASGDTVYVVFSTSITPPTSVYCVRSTDGGLSFGDTVRVDDVLPENARFPGVAIGADGNPVVHFMRVGLSEENPRYVVSSSSDGGMTFGPAVEAAAGITGEACDCCPAAILAHGDNHILLFRNNHTNEREMQACFSHDGSQTYTATAAVDTTGWMVNSCPSSGPSAIISGDSLVTTWMSENEVYLSSVHYTTHEMGTHRLIFPAGTGTQNFPVIAGKGDTLAIAWQKTSFGSTMIFFTMSLTGPGGLGADIDTVTATDPGNQTRPNLAYADGVFHLTYADSDGNNVKYRNATVGVSGLTEGTTETAEMFCVNQEGQTLIRINHLQKKGELSVYDISGKVVFRAEVASAESQDILFAGAKPGVYFLTLETEKRVITRPTIVH